MDFPVLVGRLERGAAYWHWRLMTAPRLCVFGGALDCDPRRELGVRRSGTILIDGSPDHTATLLSESHAAVAARNEAAR